MGKRSQRRLSRHERDEAGCMRALISIFDFRHSRSTKRLLLDKRQVSKQAVGAGHLSTKTVLPDLTASLQNLADEESKMPLIDSAKTSVKELMEEEMSNEHGPTNQAKETDMGTKQIDTKHGHHTKKSSKKKNRICNKSSDMDAVELDKFLKVLEQRTSDNLDVQTIIEELAHIHQRTATIQKHGLRADADTVNEEKIVAALKLFIENSLSNSKHFGEEGKSRCPKELMDALQILSSNKGLALKLLQDPNSILVKQIEYLEDFRFIEELTPSALPESGLLEEKPKSDEISSRKHHYLFRRRSKSLESLPIERDTNSHSSNKIVILKPGPGGAHSPDSNVTARRMSFQSDSNERNASQFSFNEIKRKLRHAMGKERNAISHEELILVSPRHQNRNNGDKSANGETLGWSSPNRNHFYTERFAKSFTRLKDNGSAMINGNSNIYTEAKKHLSEILNNGETTESMTGKLQKPLGRILSFSEYGTSTCNSPREKGDEVFITAQMRLSPRGMANNNIVDNHPSPSRNSLESQSRISYSNSNDEIQPPNAIVDSPSTNNQACCLIENSVTTEVRSSSEIKEITESKSREEEKIITETSESKEEKIINISSESCGNSAALDIPNEEVREMDMEEIASQCLNDSPECIKSDLIQEDQISSSQTISPPCSPVNKEVEDPDCAVDHVERPSPVSVLDPLFLEDDVSPASKKSLSVEKEIQPLHIHFEEQSPANGQGTCIRISLEDEESAFEYVEAVLLGSGLNWEEFLLRWLAFQEILDSSLFDEVELFSSRSRHDQKFLFDCANQALVEVCEIHFGCFTGMSHVKNIYPVPKGMDLIHEIWKRVEWQLVQNPQRHSLDQLVKIDMAGCGTWMILQSDIELIGSELGDAIFDELVDDIVLSFVDDTWECEFQVLLAECSANEDANL